MGLSGSKQADRGRQRFYTRRYFMVWQLGDLAVGYCLLSDVCFSCVSVMLCCQFPHLQIDLADGAALLRANRFSI